MFPIPLLGLFNVKKIFTFVIANWKIILFGGMAFVIWYQNFNETRFMFGAETIPSLEKRLSAAIDAIDICKSGNELLSATIDERNAEVKEWKSISMTLEKNIENLNTELEKIRTDTNTEVAVILRDETPKTCKAAMNWPEVLMPSFCRIKRPW